MRVPVYSLADSLAVADAIYKKGGGSASNDQLAAFLGYKSTNNGSYLSRVAAARIFDFVGGQGNSLTITLRAQSILMPEYTHTARAATIQAFLDVPLYKAIYDEYHGKDLPSVPFGMSNALRTRFGVAPSRVEGGLRAFLDSADQAGFFEVRGNRTQLIIPRVPDGLPRKVPPFDSDRGSNEPRLGGNGGGGGDDGGNPPPITKASPKELKNEYVMTLIRLLGNSTSGEERTELMGKIDKLLDLAQ